MVPSDSMAARRAGGAFVVGTGRCGSTLLSKALALHPEVLSLSEFFASLAPEPFPAGPVSGEELWNRLTDRDSPMRPLIAQGMEPAEFLYPVDSGLRFDRSTGVPRISATTLPFLSSEPDRLLDRLAEAVPDFPTQPADQHYRRLFSVLGGWLGRPLWVERSGASGFFTDQLVKNFPTARFLHLTRDPEDTARSMSRHTVFRLLLLRGEFVSRCGADVLNGAPPAGAVPPDLVDLMPGRFSKKSFDAWTREAESFRLMVSFQTAAIEAALARLPAAQVLTVRYEDILERPCEELAGIGEFLGLPAPEKWAQDAAGIVRPAPAAASGRSGPKIPRRWDIVSSVGITALGVASARAIETHRDDALINDPFAAAFVRAAALPNPMPTTPEELAALSPPDSWIPTWRYMGVRTLFFDHFFQWAGANGLRQVVLLASGLDARPFRLHWPAGTVVFEVDQPDVLGFKKSVLDQSAASARCEHHFVGIDLREDWTTALCEAGFDRKARTVWLVEGLLPYLPPEAEHHLLDAIDQLSVPGSRIAIEDAKKIGQTLPDDNYEAATRQWGVDLRTLVHEDDQRDAVATLETLGWKTDAEPIGRVAERYGHPLNPALSTTIEASRFITAELCR
ncbi:methyltransferase [Pseudofrankia inefficax]|uniref:Methyltransferase n=2 Tax=Pseudofrankia inefficax (strain DSM 45817 / CECT 9037 / DDB 130130 / EuI1c) TaxID=298654 RepID=E3IWP8_PSEI1|nr:methyltransferase [Pseudofrankia inefficax]